MLLLGSSPPLLTTPVRPPCVRRPAPSRCLSKNGLQRRTIHGAVPCDLESPGSSYPPEDEDCTVDVIILDTSHPYLLHGNCADASVASLFSSNAESFKPHTPPQRQDPPPCDDGRRVSLKTVCTSSLTNSLAHNDLRHCLTKWVVPRDSAVTPHCSGDVSERNLEKQRYLAGRTQALADMKRFCFDEDCFDDDCPSIQSLPSSVRNSPPKNPSSVPATVRDERRVVFQTESVSSTSNSNGVCEVTEVVSDSDVKERQEQAEQNRLNALVILRQTFSTSCSVPPAKPPCPTTSASSMNHSGACLEFTSVVRPSSTRQCHCPSTSSY